MKVSVDYLLMLSVLKLLGLFVGGNVIPAQRENELKTNSACGGRVYVEDSIVLYAPFLNDCTWEIETQNGRILAFTLVEGKFEQALEYFTIHDGFQIEDRAISLENQVKTGGSRRSLSQAIYTTSSVASVRFAKSPTSHLKIRISKAVECLPNLGSGTECGRIVDDVSCYCAVLTNRSQTDQTNFCANNGMKLLSLESEAEELAIQAYWGTGISFWTSLTDIAKEGEWIWQSTNASSTAYTNWNPGEPNDTGGNEDCMVTNYLTTPHWNDYICTRLHGGICERHP